MRGYIKHDTKPGGTMGGKARYLESIRKNVKQVDPEFNPDQVMGPGDQYPRQATALEREALSIKSQPDLCICGTMTRAEHGCLCGEESDDWMTLTQSSAPEETVLQEADRLTVHARGKNYGHPSVDFQKVVGMAMALWGRGPESPEEHALYMILVKLARLEATPGHHDSIVDIAGYIKTYDMVIQEKVSRLTS